MEVVAPYKYATKNTYITLSKPRQPEENPGNHQNIADWTYNLEKTSHNKKNIGKITTIYFQKIPLYLPDIACHKSYSKKLIRYTRKEVQVFEDERQCKMCCKGYLNSYLII